MVILHDTRLIGEVEGGRGRVVRVDGTTPLAQAFRHVSAAATASGEDLAIACHGYMSRHYDRASHSIRRGGTGLELCRELLRLSNISMVSTLRGVFGRIWLMSCGPAGTLIHESRPFCREFAHHADAEVIASDTPQLYAAGTHSSAERVSRPVLRFGTWEGSVYRFLPDGSVHGFRPHGSPIG